MQALTKPHLTKPQYLALSKWASGKEYNNYILRVREDVYSRLGGLGFLRRSSYMHGRITPEGVIALAAYEAKNRRLSADAE
jgi:hypothetical protein